MSRVDNCAPGLSRSWFAVALATEVTTDPQPVSILGVRWVVLRLEGELVAFLDRCPHRGAPLSIGSSDGSVLRCGYHGWEFEGRGACSLIPALGAEATIPPTARLTEAAGVQERYGLVWVAPEPPVCGLPEFDEWEDPSFDTAWSEPRQTTAGAAQLCDNFLDAAHIPVVHTGTFGVPGTEEMRSEPVQRDGWKASTNYEVVYRNVDDPLVHSGEHPLEQPQELYKELRPATTALIRLHLPLTGKTIAFLFACLPVAHGRSTVFKMMARNDFDGDEGLMTQALKFEDEVLDEDLAILEAYPSQELPLDLTAEVHTRVDRLSATYRRVLTDLISGRQT